MSIPTPYVLQIRRRVVGPPDAHGNSTITYEDPVDWPVHGIAPGANDLTDTTNRDLSKILWTVYAPAGGPQVAELDMVTMAGVDYLVDGHPKDWSQGPWDHPDAGVTVELRTSEG